MTVDRRKSLGCRPSLPDGRDEKFAYAPPRRKIVAGYDVWSAYEARAPVPIDLRSRFGPPRDQQRTNSCVGFACAAAYEFLYPEAAPLSAWWAYYWARYREDCVSLDDGCSIRDCLKELSHRGICDENWWPFKPDLYAGMPTFLYAPNDGLPYHRVRESHILDCLAEGFPVIAAIPCYPSMFTDEVERTGVVPMPGDEGPVGGHAILIVGKKGDDWVFRNSWDVWGDKGYGYLAEVHPLIEAWTVRRPA